jgi:Zn-dependent M28 family amino/carboxypeptidase
MCCPILAGLIVAASGCQAVPAPDFDAARAFDDLVAQTEFGPRVPGSGGHRACAAWLQKELALTADSVWVQPFYGTLPGVADSVAMMNIVARFHRGQGSRVLLGAHWDTRLFADRDPDPTKRTQSFAGANDGASGVAVLLEVARRLAEVPGPVGVDIVLFDGEDTGVYGKTPGNWIQGSRHFAAHLPAEYEWVIVVDMVGDRDLQLPQEGYSRRLAPDLVERVWSAAERTGAAAFQRRIGQEIIDDHLPFLMRGIPAIDIIDIDYPYWHTADDTVDKCDTLSLDMVGQTLLEVIYAG